MFGVSGTWGLVTENINEKSTYWAAAPQAMAESGGAEEDNSGIDKILGCGVTRCDSGLQGVVTD